MIKNYCPITGGLKTRITKHTYIKACLKYRGYIDDVKVPPGARRRPDHSKSCRVCERGKAIEAGKPFSRPTELEFIPLPDTTHIRPRVLKEVIERLGRGETQKFIAVALELDKKIIRSIKKEYLGR